MKCVIYNCNQEVVVAGPPPGDRGGMCWKHAIGFADTLAETSPGTIARATGVTPVDTEKQRREMDKLNKDIGAVTGGGTLKRLGAFNASS